MSATVDFELARDEYPDLFDGVEAEHVELFVEGECDDSWYGVDEWIEGTDEIDAYEAAKAVGLDAIEDKWRDRYG